MALRSGQRDIPVLTTEGMSGYRIVEVKGLDRLRDEAASLGTNAVLSVRLTTSMVMQGAAEILAYATAVLVEKE